jgi:hypothetical protein
VSQALPLFAPKFKWLETAHTLDEDAFSWGVIPPTKNSCAQAIKLLTELHEKVNQHPAWEPNALVLGPISSGGIGIEIEWLHQGDKHLFVISVFNDYPIETEYGKNGEFDDVAPFTGDPFVILQKYMGPIFNTAA